MLDAVSMGGLLVWVHYRECRHECRHVCAMLGAVSICVLCWVQSVCVGYSRCSQQSAWVYYAGCCQHGCVMLGAVIRCGLLAWVQSAWVCMLGAVSLGGLLAGCAVVWLTVLSA